ncbi:MAG: hypothetical protein ABI683_12740, partial [Ginsengibacter sp.]
MFILILLLYVDILREIFSEKMIAFSTLVFQRPFIKNTIMKRNYLPNLLVIICCWLVRTPITADRGGRCFHRPHAGRNYLPFLLGIIFLLQPWASTIAQQKLGIFDGHTDVGTDVKPGSATFIPQTGQYVITGAGYNIWGDHDEFQFVWKKMKGDFILYTKAEFLGSWVNYHRKVGWMVRKTLDGKSPHVNAVVHGDGLTSLQFRRTEGAQTEEIKSKLTKANIIQLERKGNTYTM